jgi:hypothetical protein
MPCIDVVFLKIISNDTYCYWLWLLRLQSRYNFLGQTTKLVKRLGFSQGNLTAIDYKARCVSLYFY